MIINLSPKDFLEKLQEVSKNFDKDNPIEVPALRHIVPTFVRQANAMELQQSVVTHLSFKFGGDEYKTREQVTFNKYGEADLTKLETWEVVVTKRLIPGVQPIKSLRTGAF
jgi:hypothetical protein